MDWKYRTDRSTRDRKHSPLTGDLTIWDAVLGKHLIWVRFVCDRGGEGESSLEPLGSEVNCSHRLNTHLATSSETDRAFLRRTVLSSGLLLGEGHREGKDWAGLSFSAFSMFSVCWHWNKRAKVMVLERLGEKRPKISVSISTQGIRKRLCNKCCPHRHSCKPHHWNSLLKNKMGLKQTQMKLITLNAGNWSFLLCLPLISFS